MYKSGSNKMGITYRFMLRKLNLFNRRNELFEC